MPRSTDASMKVPPKRKGNGTNDLAVGVSNLRLNESPSEKEGKCEVHVTGFYFLGMKASMKVPPKRKGNF